MLKSDSNSDDLPHRLPVLTLSGDVFIRVTEKYRLAARLPEKPLRFADLRSW